MRSRKTFLCLSLIIGMVLVIFPVNLTNNEIHTQNFKCIEDRRLYEPVKSFSDTSDYDFSSSEYLPAGWYGYEFLDLIAGTEVKMWGQTANESQILDFYIIDDWNYEKFRTGESYNYESRILAEDHAIITFDVPVTDTYYFIWSNIGGSVAVNFDYVVDKYGDDIPTYSGHWMDYNIIGIQGGHYTFAKIEDLRTDEVISGEFASILETEAIDFFICDYTNYAKFDLIGSGYLTHELMNDVSSGSWSFQPTSTEDYYIIYSAKDATDALAISLYIERDDWEEPSISLVKPSIGTSWVTGTYQTITWTSTGIIQKVDLKLFKGGLFEQTIAEEESNDGSYSWYLPSDLTLGSDYQIKILDSKDSTVFDVSDEFSTSEPKQIVIGSPTKGEKLEAGSTYNIEWSTEGVVNQVKIVLSRGKDWSNSETDSGIFHSIIVSNTENTGEYSWTIPDSIDYGTLWRIEIFDASDELTYDISEYFTINTDNIPDIIGSTTPKLYGFNFALEVGSYWQYGWSYNKRSSYSGTGTTTTGSFVVSLVSSKTISTKIGYEIKIVGSLPSGISIKWKYLSVYDQKFSGSETGYGWITIINAKTGSWYGGGFFTTFSNTESFTAASTTLDNNFITTSAYFIKTTGKEGGCETISGYTICEDYENHWDKREYYKGGIGPIGLYSFVSGAYSGGGYSTYTASTYNIGLTNSLLPSERGLSNTETVVSTTDTKESSSTSHSYVESSSESEGISPVSSSGFLFIPLISMLIFVSIISRKKRLNMK